MSVRIYQLSKEIGVENSELIQLLRERGHEVRSASSTVDNISADSLREEFGNKGNKVAAEEGDSSAQDSKEPAKAEPALPPGAIVRTRDEIEQERAEREREEAERRAAQSALVQPPQPRPVPQPGGAPPPVGKAPPPVRAMGKVPPPVVTPRGGPGVQPPSRAVPQRAADEGPRESSVEEKIRAAQQASDQRAADAKPAMPTIEVPKAPAPEAVTAPQQDTASAGPAPAAPKPPPQVPQGSQPPRISAPPRAGAAPMAPPSRGAPRPPAPPASRGAEPAKPAASTAPAAATPAAPAAPDAAKPRILVKPPIVVRDFAVQIGKKPFQLISELMEMNIFASMNQIIEEDVAQRIAEKHGFELDIRHRGEAQAQQQKKEEVQKVDEEELQEPRPPVVCILGHVDHGKTTLLDTIRKTNVVAGEAGGITQHIGAYQIEHNGNKITFIDTPGHAAFSNMRARGANVTDIAILVVAADDGFMPQTDEALGHARKAGVPVVVAINKVDAAGANPDRVRRQLQERNLTPEDWGGETLAVPVSAIKGEGIDNLLDAIILQTEVTEGITANPKGPAEGVVMEAQKEIGVGPTASVIIEKGTLQRGDALVCGTNYCRVRSLLDDKGKQIKSAGPSTPVKIIGWSGTPDAGDTFITVKNEREAKRMAEENDHMRKLQQSRDGEPQGRASLDELFAAIEQTRQKTFLVVVKADVFGTAEALAVALEQIKSQKIKLEVIDMGVGAISKNDILMASAAGASIVGFGINLEAGAASFAKHHSIRIFQHNIIYELIDQVKDAMADELEPELRENKLGAAEVRQVFPVAKGFVAGCMVIEGRIVRNGLARLIRKDKVIHESRISTLRRFKDDASEVRAGYECGIQVDGAHRYEEGDVIECLEILKIKASL